MAGELSTSAIYQEVAKIQQAPGSPYHRLEVLVHAGGKEVRPLQTLSYDIDQQPRTEYTDKISIVLSFGTGTLMNEIGPFQDDLKITINKFTLNGAGVQDTGQAVESRTYKAYLGDHIPRPTDANINAYLQDTETANRTITHTVFIIEETAVSEMRKQSFGAIIPATPPGEAAKTLMSRFAESLKLGTDEVLNGLDFVEANNTSARNHIVIEDGTPVLEIPDILQNEQGGIYSSCLGYYIHNQTQWFWPMYDTARFDTARRVLQILLAPSKHSIIFDKTWSKVGRMLSIYSAGISKLVDDSLGNLNTQGNATRFADSGKLMEDFGTVDGNKLTMSRSTNNNEYATAVVGNGQNYAVKSDAPFTSNVYLEASKKAMLAGAIMIVPWRRSDPSQLTPGMPTEVLYEYNNDIRTISGVLLGATHRYELEGQGMQAFRYLATSSLMIFVDRSDPDYIAYLKNGGTLSAAPEIGGI